jgi:hypothetical protein
MAMLVKYTAKYILKCIVCYLIYRMLFEVYLTNSIPHGDDCCTLLRIAGYRNKYEICER